MADVKTGKEEQASPLKRKPDPPESIGKTLEEEECEADSIKKRKLETPSGNDAIPCDADGKEDKLVQPQNNSNPEIEEQDDDDEEDDYQGEEDDEDEESDREEAIVDIKGKGIAVDDKGKGKMIEESDDDDSSDDCESELSGVDSDLSDDPLAEVDLDNILPSRTRRRSSQPGLHVSNDRNGDSDA